MVKSVMAGTCLERALCPQLRPIARSHALGTRRSHVEQEVVYNYTARMVRQLDLQPRQPPGPPHRAHP